MVQAVVYDLTEDNIIDLIIYGCVVWFHPETSYRKAHYHILAHTDTSDLEECIFCLCDRTVVAFEINEQDWKDYICNVGKRVFPVYYPDDAATCLFI